MLGAHFLAVLGIRLAMEVSLLNHVQGAVTLRSFSIVVGPVVGPVVTLTVLEREGSRARKNGMHAA